MDNPGTKQNELPDEPTDVETRRVSTESTGIPEVKRQSKGKRKSVRKAPKTKIKKVQRPVVSQSQASGKTAIISVVPGIWKSAPAPSGAVYVWSGPGAQVLVANEDVDFIMSRNSNSTRECCGSGGRIYFQLLEE